ncbi:MAG: PEP-CTERM sorting domain-containing protein [Phycisphaeraceae bacterium]
MQQRTHRVSTWTISTLLCTCGVALVAPAAHGQEGEDEIRLYPFDGTDPSPGGGPFDLNIHLGIDVPPDPIGPDWDLDDPTAPSIRWASPDHHYRFAFALGTDAPGDWQTTYDTTLQEGPDEQGVYRFVVEMNEVSGVEPTPFMYLVTIQAEATEGSWDFNWAGFNPQPEPPPLDPLVGFAFDVQPNSPTRVAMTVRIQNENTGAFVPFSLALMPGDTDGDGDIDDSDLGTAFANYTGPVGAEGGKTAAQGDTDGDGDVDDSDLGTAFASYTGPLGPASTAVPEPASVALLGLAGLAVAHRRRWRAV